MFTAPGAVSGSGGLLFGGGFLGGLLRRGFSRRLFRGRLGGGFFSCLGGRSRLRSSNCLRSRSRLRSRNFAARAPGLLGQCRFQLLVKFRGTDGAGGFAQALDVVEGAAFG